LGLKFLRGDRNEIHCLNTNAGCLPVWDLFFVSVADAEELNRTVLPIPDQPFKGKTGLRAEDM
jgi:hypothetical protein